jgi:hypothetical protein
MKLSLLQSVILASMLADDRVTPEPRPRKSLPHLELEQGPASKPKFGVALAAATQREPVKGKRKLSRAERKRARAKGTKQ